MCWWTELCAFEFPEASPEPVLQAGLQIAASGPLRCVLSAHSPLCLWRKTPARTSDWAHRLAMGLCFPSLLDFWFLSWGMAPAGPGTRAVGIPKHRKWFLMLGSAAFLLPESESRWAECRELLPCGQEGEALMRFCRFHVLEGGRVPPCAVEGFVLSKNPWDDRGSAET